MEIEGIIDVLEKTNNRHLALRRTLKQPSVSVNSYRTYAMELWDIGMGNILLFKVEETGLYTDESKKELVSKAEKKFIEKLFALYNIYFPERFNEKQIGANTGGL